MSDEIEQAYLVQQAASLATGVQKTSASHTVEVFSCQGHIHGPMKENIRPLQFPQCGQRQFVKQPGRLMSSRTKSRMVDSGTVHNFSLHDVLVSHEHLAGTACDLISNAGPTEESNDIGIAPRAFDAYSLRDTVVVCQREGAIAHSVERGGPAGIMFQALNKDEGTGSRQLGLERATTCLAADADVARSPMWNVAMGVVNCPAPPWVLDVRPAADSAVLARMQCTPIPHDIQIVEKFSSINHLWLLGF